MATRQHPGDFNSRVPDHETHFDRAAKRPRFQDFVQNAWDAANPLGDHIIRECQRQSFSTCDSRSHDNQSLMNKPEEANYAADAEMKNIKLEMIQWRKAAKAIASVLDGSAEISSKTTELESLVLYYSNRAVKRMSLGKMRKALDDCRIAARLDPSFLKACLTAGNCHLALGELDDAVHSYNKCLENQGVCLDRRFIVEASDGIQNAKKVVCCIKQSAELLQQKASESISKALVLITDALSISCYSEKVLEVKGEALFTLQKYDEVVQLCEKTFSFAEKNCGNNHLSDEERKRPLKLWRWRLMSMSYFRLDDFDKSLVFLQKYLQIAHAETNIEGPSTFSIATISEIFRCKVQYEYSNDHSDLLWYLLSAGNEAYKVGRHREAVEHYSKAVHMSVVESRSFAASCLCYCAAAHQALGEVVNAIADCNLAIALDGCCFKAVYIRWSLHEKIRDYEHAALDLLRYITLLEEQSEDKYLILLPGARQRLSLLSKYLKKSTKLDHYLILGLKGSESGLEIKKAYHKAALRHHPDKIGKFLSRYGDVWKEIFEAIYKDADKLFKIISEAYAVLSVANEGTQVPS